MFGILLMGAGTFFDEISDSIGKDQVSKKNQSIFSLGFLSIFFAFIFFILIALFKGSFTFNTASLPTYAIRIILEVVQAHVTIHALCKADRTTFGFIRILTIPLLLLTDLFLGYNITNMQLLGVILIVLTLFFLLINHGVSKKGAGLVLFTALNAVITISLYKYHIDVLGNSVEAEQFFVYLVLFIYFILMSKHFSKENPFKLLKKKIFFAQSLSRGVSGVLFSFAFLFAPASIIIAAKRSFSILWTIVSGNVIFKEKRPIIKIIAFLFIVVGIVMLTKI